MKLYSVDKLFLASVGFVTSYTKEDGKYRHFNEQGFSILVQDTYSSYEYKDIFSKAKYKSFHSIFCDAGDNAINSQVSLPIFIQKYYDLFKVSPRLEKIAYKILNNKSVTIQELYEIVFVLNNKKELKKPSKQKCNNVKIFTDLSKKKYKLTPCFGRDKEFEKLITTIPQTKENPILVGDHGVGKSAIVYGLIDKIKKNDVPNFLKNKKIIKLNNLDVCNNNIEEKLINIIAHCIKNNIILFIDDIDKLIDYKIFNIIKEAINHKNLKIIGTTTLENYNKYFSNEDFSKILIEEPNGDELITIIKEAINNYSNLYNIKIDNLDEVINFLIEFTSIKNRSISTNNKVENEKISNPDLVLKIIDKMFANAIIKEQKTIDNDNIIYAINECDKIQNDIKDEYVKKLKKEK